MEESEEKEEEEDDDGVEEESDEREGKEQEDVEEEEEEEEAEEDNDATVASHDDNALYSVSSTSAIRLPSSAICASISAISCSVLLIFSSNRHSVCVVAESEERRVSGRRNRQGKEEKESEIIIMRMKET